MLAWIRQRGLTRGAWLCLGLLLVACASVLGIEERSADSADSYPAQGYAGCRPGGSCSGCLRVHERECEVRGACSAAATTDDCAGCVCSNCLEPVVDCQLDPSCAAIWQCLKQSRCDLSEGVSGSCGDACAGVIDAHGGARGAAFRAAVEIRSCAATSSCLNCLAPEPEPPAGCSQANACQDCPDCFRQCLCTGEKFGVCKEFCVDDAPAATCTPENSCGGCSNCFELCTCGGDGYEHCTSACQGGPPVIPPVTQCALATGCNGCADCRATCGCRGFALAQCESDCAPPSPDDVCVDRSDEGETCGGCSGCISSCTCEGDSLERCMVSCGVLECCANQSCGGDMTYCTCDSGSSADACAQASHDCGNASSCSACACRNCPGKYALCQETPDCPAVFECMRSTQCQGSACQERCGSVGSGGAGGGSAFDVAEALWACDRANFCGCETPPQETLQCSGPSGAVTCSDYEASNALLPACCPGAVGSDGTSLACGLDLRRYFPNARQCEAFSQGNRPRIALLEACPARTIFEPPYNGAQLTGCCNSAANTCGLYDDITGLGCLNNSVFGVQPRGCGLL